MAKATSNQEDQNEACPFCAPHIADFEYASAEHFAAIYNRSPVLPGHSLIIPRRHASRMDELTDRELCELITFARAVTDFLVEEMNADAFDWTIQDGEPAGQSVAHVHLHVIPRWNEDLPNPGDWYPRLEEYREQQQSGAIDSADRPALPTAERKSIVQQLRSGARLSNRLSAPPPD